MPLDNLSPTADASLGMSVSGDVLAVTRVVWLSGGKDSTAMARTRHTRRRSGALQQPGAPAHAPRLHRPKLVQLGVVVRNPGIHPVASLR